MKTLKFVSLAAVAALCAGCGAKSGVPNPGSSQYRELCSAFYLGLAALQSGEDVNARQGLTRATRIAPGEPAGWVNLGLLDARQQEYDAAYNSFEKARALAPDNSRIETFLGLVESKRGKVAETLAHYRKAVSLDASNLRALYSLAVETERQQTGASTGGALNLLGRIRTLRPRNTPVLLDIVRLFAKQNDRASLKTAVAALRGHAAGWPDAAREQLVRLEQAAAAADFRNAAIYAQFLRNTLVRDLSFRRGLEEITAPAASAGEPFLKFVRLPSPASEPSPPDTGLHFTADPARSIGQRQLAWIGSIVFDAEGRAETVWADAAAVHVGGAAILPLTQNARLGRNSLLAGDLNYDFKTDLVVATSAGITFLRQHSLQRFIDVTAKTKLPPAVIRGSYNGAWAADIDLDGDLDVVAGVSGGEAAVFRNNGDDTFALLRPFQGADDITSFAGADIDSDGTPDVALIDGNGGLRVFSNQRLGSYATRGVPQSLAAGNAAAEAADLNGDGLMDFVLLRRDGKIVRLSGRGYGNAWDMREIASASRPPASLILADLDNNGALDVIAGGQVFLGDGRQFAPLPARLPFDCWSVADLNGDGLLDALGIAPDRKPARYITRATKNYGWQVIRTRAASTMGDQRINPFGIGGEIEIRSGLLTQKQNIQSPVLHFGLGGRAGVEFARIVWPNGIVQAEFALSPRQSVLARQRLKGSCPFLFTWDGHRMRFLKDVAPMSAALGAHPGTQSLEHLRQTEQWFRIAGGQLAPRNGYYDLRLTGEYWETYYIDHYSLMVVDHPPRTHIYVDERVANPPAPLRVYVTAAPQSFAAAMDESRRDAGAAVCEKDGTYLDGFGAGQYQGLARDHWVELELPRDAPLSGPLYLLGDGHIHPWDDTVTMARSQGRTAAPEDLRIEVPDRQGRWATAVDRLGIPAGRLKTVVLDISGIFRPGAPRRLRLRTNMEIYWDKLAWARGMPDAQIRTRRLTASAAELRYRGFSLITQASPSAPELARYESLVRTGHHWRSLEGYYTRYGDVRELLGQVDGRFVIAGSGDELRMRFPEIPAARGWERDFVFLGNGWLKEGDYNGRFSRTVQPLPYLGLKHYRIPLVPLEQDRAYQLHPADWQSFHTRYLTAEPFVRALWARTD